MVSGNTAALNGAVRYERFFEGMPDFQICQCKEVAGESEKEKDSDRLS